MDMTNLLVTGSTILLIVSKIPDFITTWQGISSTKNPGMEQNPIARWMFEQWGVNFSFVILAFVYLVVAIGSLLLFFPTVDLTCAMLPMISPMVITWFCSIIYTVFTLFVALVQFQAAQYNQSGKMKQPLRWVYGRLLWFYRT